MFTVSLSVYIDAHWCLSQNRFGYTEVTPMYSGEHCGHWHTLGVGSLSCGSITKLAWIFFFTVWNVFRAQIIQFTLFRGSMVLLFDLYLSVPMDYYAKGGRQEEA